MSGQPLSLMCPCGKKLAEYPFPGPADRLGLGPNVTKGPPPNRQEPDPDAFDELLSRMEDAQDGADLPDVDPAGGEVTSWDLRCPRCRRRHHVDRALLDQAAEALGAESRGRHRYKGSDKRRTHFTVTAGQSGDKTHRVSVALFDRRSE